MAWLVALARKNPGTTSPFSSPIDPFQINIRAFPALSAVPQKRNKLPPPRPELEKVDKCRGR